MTFAGTSANGQDAPKPVARLFIVVPIPGRARVRAPSRKAAERELRMQTGVTRRRVLAGSGAAIAMAGLPLPGLAEDRPVKIGLLTVKTGPLAQGGIQMEQGTTLFLKHSGNKLA